MRLPWLFSGVALIALVAAGPAVASQIDAGSSTAPTTSHPRPAPAYAVSDSALRSACAAPAPPPRPPIAPSGKRPTPTTLIE